MPITRSIRPLTLIALLLVSVCPADAQTESQCESDTSSDENAMIECIGGPIPDPQQTTTCEPFQNYFRCVPASCCFAGMISMAKEMATEGAGADCILADADCGKNRTTAATTPAPTSTMPEAVASTTPAPTPAPTTPVPTSTMPEAVASTTPAPTPAPTTPVPTSTMPEAVASTTPAPTPAPTTPAPAAPLLLAKAPPETKHFVDMDVTMPYTVDQFKTEVQTSFKKAVASAAGTVPENVLIVSIEAARRRNSGVVVKTKILAIDAKAVTAIKSTLGSGDVLKTKLNTALKNEGLEELTVVTPPVTGVTSSAARSTSWTAELLVAAALSLSFTLTVFV